MRAVNRSRWAAIGAAVAVSLGAGGISLTHAAISSGDKPVYVSLSQPCRVADTRPASTIGPKSDPIQAGEVNAYEIQITGGSGDCTGGLAIPADAVGVSLNLTAIAPSAPTTGRSFFTAYPGDASLPGTSNLNFLNGQAPVANKVDVGLSATGTIKIVNNEGTAHAAVDVFGYYVDHNHDDRAAADYAGGNQQVDLTIADQVVRSVSLTAPADGKVIVNSSGYVWIESGTDIIARCSLTTGTTIDTSALQYVNIQGAGTPASDVISGTRGYDVTAGQTLTVNLVCDEFSGQARVSDTYMSAIFVPA